jgi:DNA gyrase/topoisomerase IV subunit A
VHDEQRRAALQRLEILDAIAAAVERRVEVLDLIASSSSADAARSRVVDLLDVSEAGATAVLDLQWRRLAEQERSRIAEERAAIHADLA